MATTFERWREADEAWLADDHELVEIVFTWFMREKKWPTTDALQRDLFRVGHRSTNVQAVANSRPPVPGQMWMAHHDKVVLGARHLLGMPASWPLLDARCRAEVVGADET